MNRDGCLSHEFIHVVYDVGGAKSPVKTLTDQGFDENEIRSFVIGLGEKKPAKLRERFMITKKLFSAVLKEFN